MGLSRWQTYRGAVIKTFGNSFLNGYSASVPECMLQNIVAKSLGATLINASVNGSMVPDLAPQIYAQSISQSSITWLYFGVNEQWWYASQKDALYEYFGSALAAMLAYSAIPDTVDKILPGRILADTETGVWSNTGVYGVGRVSRANGNTRYGVVRGTAVIVNYIVQDTCTGVFNLKIDGVDYGNLNCYTSASMATNPGLAGCGVSYGPACVMIDGLADIAHTYLITDVSPQGAYSAVYIDMIAGVGGYAGGINDSALVLTGDIPRMTNAGYASCGGSDAGVVRCNRWVYDVVKRLQRNSLNVKCADWYSAIDRYTDLDGSGVHGNDSGQSKLAARFLALLP